MEERTKLEVQAVLQANGTFEVAAITAGQGNGWNFSPDVLRASANLWNGVDVYLDHLGWMDDNHSIHDVAGVGYNAAYDDALQGIKLTLKTLGPAGPLLASLGREILSSEVKPHVGFSADIGFTATNQDVQQITRVYSLDGVCNPARGGAFLRAIQSLGGWTRREEGIMADQTVETAAGVSAVVLQAQKDAQSIRALLDVQAEQQQMHAEVDALRAVRLQGCQYLLESGLGASKLPAPMADSVRKRFTGVVFEPADLTAALDEARALVSALTGGATVRSGALVSQMFSSNDQLQAAVDDLFEVARNKGLEAAKVHRLSGIKELYLGLTGDFDLHGAIDVERAQFQATTATFPGLVKNALNKALIERWNQLGLVGYDWWQKISHVEHFESLNSITWLIFGTIGSLSTVAEGAEYTEAKIGDSPETSTFTKYGNYVGITLEAIDRDETRKLRAVPRELANAAIRNISSLVAAIFTDNSAVGPTLADTGALFNSTAVTTAGGHLNLLTTALGTTYAAWETVAAAMYNQPLLIANESGYYGTGKKMALDPKFCLVPRALKGQAEALFVPRWASVQGAQLIAPSGGPTYGGNVDVITVPDWTDATDWAAVADPLLAPAICIGERFGLMPEIFIAGDQQSPAMFSNDESRIKVRHFVAVGVADFRPLHKSNVA